MSEFDVIDEAPTSRFHRKLLIACCGGPFLDGYVLSLIGVALIGFSREFAVTPVETGLIGAASLVGIFFGALVFGSLTDRIGREKMYAVDLAVLVAACVLSAFVTDAWQLIVLRFVIGLAVGADYPIATSLLTEFTPTRRRGFMIGVSGVAWFVGAMAAFLVGFVTVHLSGGYGLWRWLLFSGAIAGIVVVIMRRGIPESPRWLASRGRRDEAEKVMKLVYGPHATLPDGEPAEVRRTSVGEDLRLIVRGGYLRRIVMCATLYCAQITPQYALYTFGGVILAAAGIEGEDAATLGELLISVLFTVGALAALKLLESWGRRPMTVWPFALMSLPLMVLAAWTNSPTWCVVIAFAFYAFVSGGPSVLQWIYPNELFPTQIRATAVGLSVAFSRIGAAAGTYLLPVGIVTIGLSGALWVAAAITLIALVVCVAWAPETRGRSLIDTSSIHVVASRKVNI